MPDKLTAFISYSHKDAQAFVQQLYKRIAEDNRGKGLSFWQDYTNMHSGNWSRQIDGLIYEQIGNRWHLLNLRTGKP